MLKMLKYPRTPHIEGSRIQHGDEDLRVIPWRVVAGKRLVVEEKCDGANSAVSFDQDGTLLLQSRGHYLVGGGRERHYDLLKKWAQVHKRAFYDVLGSRYVMYGEWMFAKHALYYDALPHYFLEFDVFDREKGVFLDTSARRELLSALPIVSVPVLAQDSFRTLADLKRLIGQSNYIREGHIEKLREWCMANSMGDKADMIALETDSSTTMEGLYLKVEEAGQVVSRMKFVRQSFLQSIAPNDTPWLMRTIIPNGLSCGIEAIYES